jgi:A/G-specific adenine glycosylase
LAWYDAYRRELPWRKDGDPYRVWVSEIMLQQTRVAAVIEKYAQFLALFPTVEHLAAASQPLVLAAWSGLGYYRRARALHEAARAVVAERGGRLPATAQEWRELPGVGRYTSAAIASIAFGEKLAVVDGNVERLAERLLGRRLASAEVWEFAQQVLSAQRPGDFNQAMMELGATVFACCRKSAEDDPGNCVLCSGLPGRHGEVDAKTEGGGRDAPAVGTAGNAARRYCAQGLAAAEALDYDHEL